MRLRHLISSLGAIQTFLETWPRYQVTTGREPSLKRPFTPVPFDGYKKAIKGEFSTRNDEDKRVSRQYVAFISFFQPTSQQAFFSSLLIKLLSCHSFVVESPFPTLVLWKKECPSRVLSSRLDYYWLPTTLVSRPYCIENRGLIRTNYIARGSLLNFNFFLCIDVFF